MKRTRVLLVCALVVLAGGLPAVAVSGAGTATAIHAGENVSADSDGTITAEPGETVTVTVWANATEVSGYQTNVTFDSSVVEVRSVSGAEDFADPVSNVNNDAGWVAFNQIRSSETSDPILAEITFEVTGDEGDSADISFVGDDTAFSDGDGETFSSESYDGVELSVERSTPTPTETATPTETETSTPTETETSTPTETETSTPTETETSTPTETETSTPTETETPTQTETETSTETETATSTPDETETSTPTETETSTPDETETSTPTETETSTPTETETSTPTETTTSTPDETEESKSGNSGGSGQSQNVGSSGGDDDDDDDGGSSWSPPPEPSFSITDANLNTSSSTPGSPVTVSALVENTGDASGEYDAQVYVDENATDAKRTVEVEAGQERRVNLSLRFDSPGTYAVAVGDTAAGTVTVQEEETATPSPTATATETPRTTSPPSTTAESASDTPASTSTVAATEGTSTGETAESMPGFGFGVAAVTIAALVGWVGRRHGRND